MRVIIHINENDNNNGEHNAIVSKASNWIYTYSSRAE